MPENTPLQNMYFENTWKKRRIFPFVATEIWPLNGNGMHSQVDKLT